MEVLEDASKDTTSATDGSAHEVDSEQGAPTDTAEGEGEKDTTAPDEVSNAPEAGESEGDKATEGESAAEGEGATKGEEISETEESSEEEEVTEVAGEVSETIAPLGAPASDAVEKTIQITVKDMDGNKLDDGTIGSGFTLYIYEMPKSEYEAAIAQMSTSGSGSSYTGPDYTSMYNLYKKYESSVTVDEQDDKFTLSMESAATEDNPYIVFFMAGNGIELAENLTPMPMMPFSTMMQEVPSKWFSNFYLEYDGTNVNLTPSYVVPYSPKPHVLPQSMTEDTNGVLHGDVYYANDLVTPTGQVSFDASKYLDDMEAGDALPYPVYVKTTLLTGSHTVNYQTNNVASFTVMPYYQTVVAKVEADGTTTLTFPHAALPIPYGGSSGATNPYASLMPYIIGVYSDQNCTNLVSGWVSDNANSKMDNGTYLYPESMKSDGTIQVVQLPTSSGGELTPVVPEFEYTYSNDRVRLDVVTTAVAPETDLPIYLKAEILDGATAVSTRVIKIEENGTSGLSFPKFDADVNKTYTLHYQVFSDKDCTTPHASWTTNRNRSIKLDESLAVYDANTSSKITKITISNKAPNSVSVPVTTVMGDRADDEFFPVTMNVTIEGAGDVDITPVTVKKTFNSSEDANTTITIDSESGERFEAGDYKVSWSFEDNSGNLAPAWPSGSKEVTLDGNGKLVLASGDAFGLRFVPVSVKVEPQATEDEITVNGDNPLYVAVSRKAGSVPIPVSAPFKTTRTNLDGFEADLPYMTYVFQDPKEGEEWLLTASVMDEGYENTADGWRSDSGLGESGTATGYMTMDGKLQYEKESTIPFMNENEWGNYSDQMTYTEWTDLVLRPEYSGATKQAHLKVHVNIPDDVEDPFLFTKARGADNGNCVYVRLYRQGVDGMEMVGSDGNNSVLMTKLNEQNVADLQFADSLEEGTYYITWYMGAASGSSSKDPSWKEQTEAVKIVVDHSHTENGDVYVKGEDGKTYVAELYYKDEYKKLVQPVIDVDFTQPEEYDPTKDYQAWYSYYPNYVKEAVNPGTYTVRLTPLWDGADDAFDFSSRYTFKVFKTYKGGDWSFSILCDTGEGAENTIGSYQDYCDYTIGRVANPGDTNPTPGTVGGIYSTRITSSRGTVHQTKYSHYDNTDTWNSTYNRYYEGEVFVGFPEGDYEISYYVNGFSDSWHKDTAKVHLSSDGKLYKIKSDGSYESEPYVVELYMEDNSTEPETKTFDKLSITVETTVPEDIETEHAFTSGEKLFVALAKYDSENSDFEGSYTLVAKNEVTVSTTGTTTVDLLPVSGNSITLEENASYYVLYGTYTDKDGDGNYSWTARWKHTADWLGDMDCIDDKGVVCDWDYSGDTNTLKPYVVDNASMLLPWEGNDPESVKQYDGNDALTLKPIKSYKQVQDKSTYMIVAHNNYDNKWYALAYDEDGGHQVLLEDVQSIEDLKKGYKIDEHNVPAAFLLTANKSKQATDSVEAQFKTNAKDENGKSISLKMGASANELEPLLTTSAGTVIVRNMDNSADADAPTFQLWRKSYAALSYTDELFGKTGFTTIGAKYNSSGSFIGYHSFPFAAKETIETIDGNMSYYRVNSYYLNGSSYISSEDGPYMVDAPKPWAIDWHTGYIYDGDPSYIQSDYLTPFEKYLENNAPNPYSEDGMHLDFYILSDNQEEATTEENNTYTRVLTFGDFNNTFILNGGSSSSMVLIYTDEDGKEWALTPKGLVEVKTREGASGYNKVITGAENELVPNNNSGTSSTFGFACVDISGAAEQVFATDYAFRKSPQNDAAGIHYLTLTGDDAWTASDDEEHGDGLVYVLQPTETIHTQSDWDTTTSYRLVGIKNGVSTWLGVKDGKMVAVDSEEEAITFDVYAPSLTRYYSSANSSDLSRYYRVYSPQEINAGDEILIVYRDEDDTRHTVSWSTGEASRENNNYQFCFPALDVLDEYQTINTHDDEFPDGARYKFRLDADGVEKKPYAYADADEDIIWAQGVAANGIGVAKSETKTQRKYESVVGLGNQSFYLHGQLDSNPLYHVKKSEINFFAGDEEGTFYIRGGKKNVYLNTDSYSVRELDMSSGSYKWSRNVLTFRAEGIEDDATPTAFEIYRRPKTDKTFTVEYHDVFDPMGDPVSTELRPQESLVLKDQEDVDDEGTTYAFVGWTTDPNKAGLLSKDESTNMFDYDDVAKLASVKDDILEKHGLLGPCDPDAVNLVSFDSISEFLTEDEEGNPVLKLYPVYAVRGFSQPVTADEGDTMIIGIADCKDYEMGGDGNADSSERWLGSVNIEVYLDGELWVPGNSTPGSIHPASMEGMDDSEAKTATMYFAYHNDDAADLNIKFIKDGIDASGLLDYLSDTTFEIAEPTERYTIDAVYAEQGGSEDGLKYRYNWMDSVVGGQLDNVRGGSTVKVYVTTKYQVKYYFDHDGDGSYDELPNVPSSMNTDEGYHNAKYYTTAGTENLVNFIKEDAQYFVTKDNDYKKLIEKSPGDTTTFRDDPMTRGEYSTFLYKFDEYEHEIPIMKLPKAPGDLQLANTAWDVCLKKDAHEKTTSLVPLSTLAVTETTRGTGTTVHTSKQPALGDTTYTYHLFAAVKTDKTSVLVNKIWDDDDDQDGIRPDSVTVDLLANGTKIDSATITAGDNNAWEHTFANLPKTDGDGKTIEYTVREAEENVPNGYDASVSSSVADGFEITNKHEHETVDIKVTKTWDDSDDEAGERPESVTVRLLANGEPVLNEDDEELTIELTSGDGWEGVFEGLDKYSDGEEIEYSVEEVDELENYEVSVDGTVEDGFTITNKYVPPEEPGGDEPGDDEPGDDEPSNPTPTPKQTKKTVAKHTVPRTGDPFNAAMPVVLAGFGVGLIAVALRRRKS